VGQQPELFVNKSHQAVTGVPFFTFAGSGDRYVELAPAKETRKQCKQLQVG
jgi:hypothetical protein